MLQTTPANALTASVGHLAETHIVENQPPALRTPICTRKTPPCGKPLCAKALHGRSQICSRLGSWRARQT
jgi:hypothetical protein